MEISQNKGAVTALLSEYARAIADLQQVIVTVSDAQLVFPVDPQTQNPDCKSIQSVLSHVVGAGYSYAVYIRNFKGDDSKRPQRTYHQKVIDYVYDLENVIRFTAETFAGITDAELEAPENAKKILTSWGQLYDFEQLMEHAIVHILRHRHQVENFKAKLTEIKEL